MDGLSRAIGAGSSITVKGRTYKLRALTLEDFGEVEQHILSQRPDPFAPLHRDLEGLPEAVVNRLVDNAYREARKSNKVTGTELTDFLNTVDGIKFSIWLCLRGCGYGVETLEDAERLLTDMIEEASDPSEAIADFKRRRDMASGIDEAGNSTGLNQATTSQQEQDSNDKSAEASPGVESSAT